MQEVGIVIGVIIAYIFIGFIISLFLCMVGFIEDDEFSISMTICFWWLILPFLLMFAFFRQFRRVMLNIIHKKKNKEREKRLHMGFQASKEYKDSFNLWRFRHPYE